MDSSALGLFEDIEPYSDEVFPPHTAAAGPNPPLTQPVSKAHSDLSSSILHGGHSSNSVPNNVATASVSIPPAAATLSNGSEPGNGHADDFFSPPPPPAVATATSRAEVGGVDSWDIPDELFPAPEQAPLPPPTPPPCAPSTSTALPQQPSNFELNPNPTSRNGGESKMPQPPSKAPGSAPPQPRKSQPQSVAKPRQQSQPQTQSQPQLLPQPQQVQGQPRLQQGHAKEPPGAVAVSSQGPSSSGPNGQQPIPPGLQMVDGKLVFQAQLQQVQTPAGIITVAVIPQSLMAGVSGGIQMVPASFPQPPQPPPTQPQPQPMMQAQPSALAASQVPAPAPPPPPPPPQPAPAKASKPRQRKQILPNTARKAKASKERKGRGNEMAVQLDPESQAEVSRLGTQIAQLRSAPQEPTTGAQIEELERQRRAIISKAFLAQYGHAATKELLPNSQPSPPPPPPQPSTQPEPNSQARPSQPQPPPSTQNPPRIVRVNGQTCMMLTKEEALAQGYAEEASMRIAAPDPVSAPAPEEAPSKEVDLAEDLAELETAMELESRRGNFARCYASDIAALHRREERDVPFRTAQDAMVRLMPYHLFASPDPSPMFLAVLDEALEQVSGDQKLRMAALEARLSRALLKEAMVTSTAEEESLLSFLLLDHEKDLLNEEKELAESDPDSLHQRLRELREAAAPQPSPSTSSEDSEEEEEEEEESELSEVETASSRTVEEEERPPQPEPGPLDIDSLPSPPPRRPPPTLPPPLPPSLPPPTAPLEEEEEEEEEEEKEEGRKKEEEEPKPLSPLKPITIRLPPKQELQTIPTQTNAASPLRRNDEEEANPLKLRISRLRLKQVEEAEMEVEREECSNEAGPSPKSPPQPRRPLKLRIKAAKAAAAAAVEEESLFDRLLRMSPPPRKEEEQPKKELLQPLRLKVRLKRNPNAEEEEMDENRRKQRKRRRKERRRQRRREEESLPLPPPPPSVPIWRQEHQPAPRLFVPKLKIRLGQEDESYESRLVIDDGEEETEPQPPPEPAMEPSDSEGSLELEPGHLLPSSPTPNHPPTAIMEVEAEEDEEEEEEFSDEFPGSPKLKADEQNGATGDDVEEEEGEAEAGSELRSTANIFALFQPGKYAPAVAGSETKARAAFEAEEEDEEDSIKANIHRLISTSILDGLDSVPESAPPRFSFEGLPASSTGLCPPPPLQLPPPSSDEPLSNSESSGPDPNDDDPQLSAIINSFLP